MNILEQIQSLVRQFRSDLKAGKEPSIRSYLERIDLSGRKNLFENLLLCELEYLRRKQKTASSEEYIKRFPQYASAIRQAFFESTMMSQDADGRTPDSAEETMTIGQPASRQLGQYELIRELGRGGFGVVYEARHVGRGDRVALKTLPTMQDGQSLSSRDADRLHRFRREFRSLAEVNHPNLVGMQTLEVDGDRWFFTMDLIDGVDFLDYVRPDDKLDVARLLQVLPQFVRGVIALHRLGIVHRDLKPSNVLVNRDGHLVILDFGLVAELQHFAGETLSMGTKQFAGTPRYAAPEQISGERTAAVDWYALGTMLFEAITGEAPIRGAGIELMIKKQNETAVPLVDHPSLPNELAKLASLVDELLQREAGERPGDETIVARLAVRLDSTRYDSGNIPGPKIEFKGGESPGAVDGESIDSSIAHKAETLIGRETQLAQLEQTYSEFREMGEPQVVFVSGRSGEGKTSLVNSFLNSLRKRGDYLIFSGRCYDRESVPFKAIDCWIDPLVSFLRARPQHELSAWLPQDIEILTELFPLLRRVPLIAEQTGHRHEIYDTRQVRHRVFAALRDLLVAISTDTRIVVMIDDLQWGDGDSAIALRDVLQPPDAPSVLLLGTYRSDEAIDSAFLKEWSDYTAINEHLLKQKTMEVGPLSQDDCLRMMADRLGTVVSALQEQADKLFVGTRGNPYLLAQLIDSVDPQTGKFDDVSLSELIERRLQRLHPSAKPLLTAIAAAGQAVALSEAVAIAGRPANAMSIVTHMRSERLVRLVGSDQELNVDTYHDKIRETVMGELTRSERQRLHLAFAEQLLSQTIEACAVTEAPSGTSDAHPRVFDLAYHLLEAGDPRAFAFQLTAGEKAQKEYAMDTAQEYLQHAERLLPADADDKTRFRLLFSMAEANRGLERFEAARQYYERALPFAGDRISAALCEYGIGNVLARQGRMREVRFTNARALALLGEMIPSTLPGQLFCIVRSLFAIHLVPTEILRLFRRGKLDASTETLICAVLSTSHYAFMNSVPAQAVTLLRSGVVGKASRNPGTKVIAYTHYALCFSGHGLGRMAQRFTRRADQVSDTSFSAITRALVAHNSGISFFFLGQLSRAEQALRISLPIMQRTRDHQAGMCLHWLRHIASVRGDANEIHRFASEELRYGEATHDSITVAYGEYGLADALGRQGHFEPAIRLAKQSIDRLRSTGLITEQIAQQELGRVQLQASEYEAAAETLRRSTSLILRKFMFQEFYLDAFSLYVEAVVGASWTSSTSSLDAKVVRLAKRLARRARWLCGRFPNLRPHAYRVSGRTAFAAGGPRKAAKYFDEAIRSAEAVGAQYELARSLIDKSWLKHPTAAADRARGLAMLEDLHCVLPAAEDELLRSYAQRPEPSTVEW